MKSKMKNRSIPFLLIMILLGFFLSCGAVAEQPLSVSGNITLNNQIDPESISSPVYVIVSRTMDMERMLYYPDEEIISFVMAENNGSWQYNIDLTETDARPDDKVFIIAFIENDISTRSLPLPSPGDYVGLYVHDSGNINGIGYRLREGEGENSNLDFEINRKYLDIDASIQGTIDCNENGRLFLIAFADDNIGGPDTDIATLNIDTVVAFSEQLKTTESVEYTLNILPFFLAGINLPLDNVSVFAVLDMNDNGMLDDGEMLGFYRMVGEVEPGMITIDPGILPGIDVTLDLTYHKSDTTIKGTILGIETGSATVVAYAGAEGELFPDTSDLSKVLGYTVVDKGSDPVSYTIKMLPFNQFPRENVSIFVLMDFNENNLPDTGEKFGFYLDNDNMTTNVILPRAGLTGIDIMLDKTYNDNDASLEGAVHGGSAGGGNVMIIAYEGELENAEISDFDISKVVAYGVYAKDDANPISYNIKILPIVTLPLGGISLLALQDSNANGTLDDGETIGFYKDSSGKPLTLTISGGIQPGIDITLDKIYYQNDVTVKGTIQGAENGTATVIAYKSNNDELYPSTLDHDSILGFTVIEKNSGTIPYTLEILPFYNFPIEGVSFFVLMDQNGNELPDDGETVGFYMDIINKSSMVALPVNGLTGIDISIDKTYNAHDVSIKGNLEGNVTGDITLIAYAGSLKDVGISDFNMDKVAAYEIITKNTTAPVSYSLRILPHIELPHDGVTIFAINDVNRNFEPDEGEAIGFYIDVENRMETIPIPVVGDVSGITITLDKTYREHDVSVSGNLTGNAIGEITIVAYQGNVDENGIGSDFDIDKVMAYTTVTKSTSNSISYSVKIFNLFELPREGVSLFALRDANNNKLPDDGELVGYYRDANNPSVELTIPGEGTVTGIDIAVDKTFYNHDTTISGNIQGSVTGEITIIAYAGELEGASFDDFNIDNVAAFAKVTKDTLSAEPYSMRIFPIFPVPLSQVSLFALMDENGNNMPDDGERLGFYSNPDPANRSITFTVPANGASGIDITVDRKYLENDVTIQGTISASSSANSASGDLLLIAYSGELDTLDTDDIDYQKVVLLKNCGQVSYPYSYSETILPFDFDFNSIPLDVSVFAIKDVNGNGIPDTGDRAGFYIDSGLDPTVSLPTGEDIDIKISKIIHDTDITVRFYLNKGTVELSALSIGTKLLYLILHENGGLTGDYLNVFSRFLIPVNVAENTLGIKKSVIDEDSQYKTYLHELPLAPLIDDKITWPPSPTLQTLVYVIADTNDNGNFDSADHYAFYGELSLGVATQHEYTLTNAPVQTLENDYQANLFNSTGIHMRFTKK